MRSRLRSEGDQKADSRLPATVLSRQTKNQLTVQLGEAQRDHPGPIRRVCRDSPSSQTEELIQDTCACSLVFSSGLNKVGEQV